MFRVEEGRGCHLEPVVNSPVSNFWVAKWPGTREQIVQKVDIAEVIEDIFQNDARAGRSSMLMPSAERRACIREMSW